MESELPGRILAFLRKLFASLLWFAAAPKEWDADLEDFELKTENGYLAQGKKTETRVGWQQKQRGRVRLIRP